MTVSEEIRLLAREGLSVAQIARRLGIRYQHAYNVLKEDDAVSAPSGDGWKIGTRSPITTKCALLVEELVRGGFEFSGRWVLSNTGDLIIDRPLPGSVGVYAFAKNETVLYIGGFRFHVERKGVGARK